MLIALVSCGGERSVDRIHLERGVVETVLVSTHCGYRTLEIDINGATWSTDTLGQDAAGNPTEPAWPSDQIILFELELVDQDTLNVTAVDSDVTHTYQIDPDPDSCA